MENLTIKRTPDAIKWIQESLAGMGVDYTLKHGTYTTTIEHSLGKLQFMTNQYKNKVFACANYIKKEVQESELGQQIMNTPHKKKNFDFNGSITNIARPKVLNIDLSMAYPYCLWNSGLISKRTFNYLQKLQKHERLPAIGMLATSHVKYFYKDGKCVDFKPYREPTSQVFFHLIDEIQYIMEDIKFILGNDYIFHWVDGVFFNYGTSQKKINEVENLLISLNYPYKYEDVVDFRVVRKGDKISVSMTKNNKHKNYEFSTGETGREITDRIVKKASKEYTHYVNSLGANGDQGQSSEELSNTD